MAYTKKYGFLMGNQFEIIEQLETKPIHPEKVAYDSASGKYVMLFRPAGIMYPAAPSRIKAGILDDTAPAPATNGVELPQWTRSRVYLDFKDGGGASVAGTADIDFWHRELPGDESAAGAPKGPWVHTMAATFVGAAEFQEIINDYLYHRELYVALSNIAGAGVASVDIYIAGLGEYNV